MDIKQELVVYKREVDKEIEVCLNRAIKEAGTVDLFVQDALKYFKKMILSGGKRIRPIMMCVGYESAGGKQKQEILKTSVSIELIHAFVLMHDDIIDRDDFRHGVKTMHARYRDYNKKTIRKDADHFGQSISIILGDFIYSLGNQVLFESNFEFELIVHALNKVQSIVGLTCVGEIQDIYMEYKNTASEEEILAMYKNKTAKYTFEGPLQLGAILAGADDEFCDSITKFAVPIGIAFQLRDDILGVFGDSKKTGKPTDSDIAEGKQTFMVKRAFVNADRVQKRELKKIWGKGTITGDEIKKFQQIIVDTGAKMEVEEYMQNLISDSQQALDNMDLSGESKDFLYELANYLNKRDK
jgi:geranylgeranyl diphosphate synthase type I